AALRDENGKPPSAATLTSRIRDLEADALKNRPVAEVYVRVAVVGGHVYVDLGDDRGRVVEIRSNGWEVVDSAPVHFVRPRDVLPLPLPQRGGTIGDLRSLINVADDDFILIVGWLLDALRNDGAHPVPVINGGEGTAKSTLAEILRALIDPR